MYNRKNLFVLAALVLAFSVLGRLPASSAQAGTPLPITSFYQIVADTAHGHLFISQGSSSKNEIIVTDLAGQNATTITGQDGVNGIALSPDGKTLYAALGSSHAVTAIDTTTLQQTASYPVGNANTPVDVAVQSGKVWVSYNTGTAGTAAVGDIDLLASQPAFQTQAAMGGWYAAPELAADPQDTGVLVAAEPGLEPSSVASYNTTVEPATVRASSNFFTGCIFEHDLAVVPGGSEFILACNSLNAYRYLTADLSQQGSYGSAGSLVSAPIDASGDVAVGTINSPPSPDLYIYRQGGDTPLSTFRLSSSGAGLMARGLAWADDGSQLFAVVLNSDSTYSLQVINGPTLIQSALSLAGPSSAYLTQKVTLTGKLTLSTGAMPATGTPITVARSVAGGSTIKNIALTTGANGSFTLTDMPPALGQYTYTASYSGDSATAPATTSRAVTVTGMPTSLTVTTGTSTFTYEPTVHVTAHLGTTYTNRTVSIYAQPFGSTSKTLLKTGAVNSSGNLAVNYTAPHSTAFSAVFSGDARYAPKTTTHSSYVRASVSSSLSGYYASSTVGGITYRLFHHTALLHVHVTVRPNKAGQCVKIEVQEFYRGAWHGALTTCGRLSSTSQVAGAFDLTRANIGFHYRMRADYIRSGADTSNLSNNSAWRYFIVKT